MNDFLAELVVIKKDKKADAVPAGFICLEKTMGGNHDTNLNKSSLHICLRRGGGPSKDPLVLADVALVAHGREALPADFVLLAKTVGGHPAAMNKGSGGVSMMLCAKILPRAALTKAVYDIQIIRPKKGDTVPAGYEMLRGNLNEGGSSSDALHLCVRYLPVIPTQPPPAANPVAATIAGANAPKSSFEAYVQAGKQLGDRHSSVRMRQGSESMLQRQQSIHCERQLKGVPLVIRKKFRDIQAPTSIMPIPECPVLSKTDIDMMFRYDFAVERKVLKC